MAKYKSLAVILLLSLVFAYTIKGPPSKLGFLPNYSLDHLQVNIQELKQTQESNHQTQVKIDEEQIDLKQTISQNENLKQTYDNVLSILRTKGVKFHLPSLLITLEQEAKNLHLSLIVHHNLIKESATNPSAQTEKQDLKKEQEEPEESPVKKIESPKDTEDTDQESSFSLVDKLSIGSAPTSDLKITLLPITVKGSYKNIHRYLIFLDELNYIESNNITLIAENNGIKADIILQVYSIPQF